MSDCYGFDKLTRAEQFERQRKYLPSHWSRETALNGRMLVFACEKLQQIANALSKPPRPKRKPTEWQKFFAEGMQRGEAPKAIAANWKSKKLRLTA